MQMHAVNTKRRKDAAQGRVIDTDYEGTSVRLAAGQLRMKGRVPEAPTQERAWNGACARISVAARRLPRMHMLHICTSGTEPPPLVR